MTRDELIRVKECYYLLDQIGDEENTYCFYDSLGYSLINLSIAIRNSYEVFKRDFMKSIVKPSLGFIYRTFYAK